MGWYLMPKILRTRTKKYLLTDDQLGGVKTYVGDIGHCWCQKESSRNPNIKMSSAPEHYYSLKYSLPTCLVVEVIDLYGLHGS